MRQSSIDQPHSEIGTPQSEGADVQVLTKLLMGQRRYAPAEEIMFGVRALIGVCTVFALVAVAAVPSVSSASPSYDWKLRCSGNWFASVAWNWTQGGVDIPGAGGSEVCGGDSTLTGIQNRPASADGFHALLTVFLPPLDHCTKGAPPQNPAYCYDSDYAVKSGHSVNVHLRVSASGYYCDVIGPCPTYAERATFRFHG